MKRIYWTYQLKRSGVIKWKDAWELSKMEQFK